jgi:uncharacterized coiled-coil protein SlyX
MGENIVTTPAEQASERAIIEAATPGPWQSVHKTDYTANGYGDCGHSDLIGPATGTYRGMIRIGVATFTNADCDFIAAARTGWPKALDERDAAIARLAECERGEAEANDIIETYVDEVKGHELQAAQLRAEVRELREQLAAVRPFSGHKFDCDALAPMWHKGPCNCGWEEVARKLDASPPLAPHSQHGG